MFSASTRGELDHSVFEDFSHALYFEDKEIVKKCAEAFKRELSRDLQAHLDSQESLKQVSSVTQVFIFATFLNC